MSAAEGVEIERRLALSYAPAGARPKLAALWAVDAALGEVVAGGGPAALREIKLVWWRDALAGLDAAPPPAQPVLEGAAALGFTGAELAAMEEPWAVLLSDDPLSEDELADYARRGRLLFGFAARLLGVDPEEPVVRGGEAWALVDLARRTADPAEAQAALTFARDRFDRGYRWPKRLRPIGMLAILAMRDACGGIEAPGSPMRMLRMFRHRLTGR